LIRIVLNTAQKAELLTFKALQAKNTN